MSQTEDGGRRQEGAMDRPGGVNSQQVAALWTRTSADRSSAWLPADANDLAAVIDWILSNPIVRWATVSLYVGAAGLLIVRATAGALVRPLGPVGFVLATSATLWLGFVVWGIARLSGRRGITERSRGSNESLGEPLSSRSSSSPGIKLAAEQADDVTGHGLGWPGGPHWDRGLRQVRQQLVRKEIPGGRELIEGTVRVHFAGGQTRAVEHIAFCPPLETVPEIECRRLDGESVTVRVEQRTTFGARLELRLSEACDEAHSVVVHFRVQG